MDGLWDHGVDMAISEERMPSYTAVTYIECLLSDQGHSGILAPEWNTAMMLNTLCGHSFPVPSNSIVKNSYDTHEHT